MTSFLDLQKENLSIEVKRSKDLKTFAGCGASFVSLFLSTTTL